jgi:hypothetical protein
MFSVVNAVLLQPLPYADPRTLTALFERDVFGEEPFNEVAPANFLDWQRDAPNVVSLYAYSVKDVRTSLLILFGAAGCVLMEPLLSRPIITFLHRTAPKVRVVITRRQATGDVPLGILIASWSSAASFCSYTRDKSRVL